MKAKTLKAMIWSVFGIKEPVFSDAFGEIRPSVCIWEGGGQKTERRGEVHPWACPTAMGMTREPGGFGSMLRERCLPGPPLSLVFTTCVLRRGSNLCSWGCSVRCSPKRRGWGTPSLLCSQALRTGGSQPASQQGQVGKHQGGQGAKEERDGGGGGWGSRGLSLHWDPRSKAGQGEQLGTGWCDQFPWPLSHWGGRGCPVLSPELMKGEAYCHVGCAGQMEEWIPRQAPAGPFAASKGAPVFPRPERFVRSQNVGVPFMAQRK